ncbi:MAG: hypothetical protein CO022_05195 [Flavobacteriales bacterium CG_4_9_14_0_2_um_filter_32_27]|nr:MAG: hypothetical protein CO022_05195 [Flavobacteriales bacterium CG_4_9_14_0_2_um_filter_32_27]
MKIRYLYFFFLVVSLNTLTAQIPQRQIDSLIHSLSDLNEEEKVVTLNNIAWNISYNDFNLGLDYAFKSIELAKKINHIKGLSRAYNTVGTIYADLGMYDEALKYYNLTIEINKKNNLKDGLASVYANIANIHAHLQNYQIAKEYYLLSNQKFRELNKVDSKVKTDLSLSKIYSVLNQEDSADYYLDEAFKSAEKMDKNPHIIANVFVGKAQNELVKNNYAQTLLYLRGAEEKFTQVNSSYDLFQVYKIYGELYYQQKKYALAVKYYTKGLDKYSKNSTVTLKSDVYKGLSDTYLAVGNFAQAHFYQTKHILITDSLNKENSKNRLLIMENTFKNERSQLELENLKNINRLQEAEIEKQNTQKIALAIGLFLTLMLVFFVLKSYREKRKANELILTQKKIVEEKHKEITDSINYAERIQRSFLATTEMLDNHLKDYFVFFKPKDVVSGDFYWAAQLNNGNFAFTCADSTGHGVPGAIMSILNISSLEKSIEKETEPNKILNKTREIIIERLKKDGSTDGGRDGMDCSLLVLNKERTQLSFAAANNPVFIVNPNRTEWPVNSLPFGEGRGGAEFKPDKMPVGKHDNDQDSFALQTSSLQKGDVIYTLTDGFSDQFGGDKGKKYMIKNFKELLLQIVHLPMLEQEKKIAIEFDNWKGKLEQVDDVCVIGVRI